MEDLISPKYRMKLTEDVEKAICSEYSSYKKILFYIQKWHQIGDFWENFTIFKNKSGTIDLSQTLHNVDGEIILKMAVDLGIETPDFIPSVPTFKNEIKSDYNTAYSTFQNAIKNIETNPDIAVGLANSALESIIKEILKDKRIKTKPDKVKTLYDLTIELLKEFQIYPESSMPIEIKTLGSSLLSATQSIEKLRSEKTTVHGKTNEDYVINDPLYTYFIVNSVTTIGLFLISFYKKKFPKNHIKNETINDLPF